MTEAASVAPTLAELIVGDLGPARRHLERIRRGQLQPTSAVLDEIEKAIERCVARVQERVA
jgi:hypothetical protein